MLLYIIAAQLILFFEWKPDGLSSYFPQEQIWNLLMIGSFLYPQMFRWEESRRLTKDSPGRDGFSVEPERHLGQDNCHDAG